MELLISRITPTAVLPTQQPDSIGWDMFAFGNHIISPAETRIIPLGWHAVLPEGFGAFVWDRSSFGSKGIHCFRQMISNPDKIEQNYDLVTFGGCIDWSYKGQWGVILHSFLKTTYNIMHGARIAQFVIKRVEPITIKEIPMDELMKIPSKRGQKGLGSSEGRHEIETQKIIKDGKLERSD